MIYAPRCYECPEGLKQLIEGSKFKIERKKSWSHSSLLNRNAGEVINNINIYACLAMAKIKLINPLTTE